MLLLLLLLPEEFEEFELELEEVPLDRVRWLVLAKGMLYDDDEEPPAMVMSSEPPPLLLL